MTYLDQPLFKLKPDTEPRLYANVSNRLEIAEAGRVRYALVQVNTSVFHLMHHFGVPPTAEVTLYLDVERDRSVFGITTDDGQFYDLWVYLTKLLPGFLK